jgi:hypothetical protein
LCMRYAREVNEGGSNFADLVCARQLEPLTTSMLILLCLGSDCKEYRESYLPVLQGGSDEELIPRTCPVCDQEGMHRHEYKTRQVKVPDKQEPEEIEVLRMRCPHCGSTHTVLPHFVLPYHTYGARTVMKALWLYAQCGCYHLVMRLIESVHNCAVLRQWVQRFREVIPRLTAGLHRFLLQHGSVLSSNWRERPTSAREPPLKGILRAFALTAADATEFLCRRLRSAILPEGDGDLLGWVHLILQRTGHLFV